MKSAFGARQALIALLLLVIIPTPRFLLGSVQLGAARIEVAAGDYTSAASIYAHAAERLPWYCPVYGEAGYAHHLAKHPVEAVAYFSRGETCQGLSMEQWLVYGDALAALGEYDPAARAWKLALVHHGPSHEALSRLAMAARQAGDIDLAIDLYQRAIVLTPDEAEAQYQLALLLVAVDPASSLPILMQVSNLDPDREEDIREIRKEINRALLVPDPAYQYLLAGRLLGSLNEWDLAAEAFQRALSSNSQYAEAWAWLAEAKQSTGRDSRAAMEKALALDSESPGIHGLDGLIWMQMGRPEYALVSYQKAASLEPENAIWQISLGDASTAAGDLSDALLYYYRAVEMAPKDPSTWRALALFSLNNDIDVAHTGLAAAEELSRLAPEDWQTYLVTGRVAMMLNKPLAARTNFLKAIEAAPEEPAPQYYLGLSLLEAQMFTLAYDKLVDVIYLDPAGIYGWQAQRLLEVYFP